MFRLTREIRFSLSPEASPHIPNSHAGHPQLTTPAPWLRAQLTFESELDPQSQYVLDIKQIDQTFRAQALPLLQQRHAQATLRYDAALLAALHEALQPHYPTARLAKLTLVLTPFQSLTFTSCQLIVASCQKEIGPSAPSPSQLATQNSQLLPINSPPPMSSLNLRFEFSAAHRLHNPNLSDEENKRLFGKCNNPHGHGHNYELQVSVKLPHPPIPELEKLVEEAVIRPYDHKHLNVEVQDFATTNPTVENIARAAYLRLRPLLNDALLSTTIWETPKTWAEYSE
jgi:6-pyruvoyl-tetrahydropterin synthase